VKGSSTAERITAWRCIGCGKIEAPQPCIGVCQDRKVDLVDAVDYDQATADGSAARSQAEDLARLVRRLAHTTPSDGEWERSYRALQAQARALLDPAGPVRR
jgi:hypothetical protein